MFGPSDAVVQKNVPMPFSFEKDVSAKCDTENVIILGEVSTIAEISGWRGSFTASCPSGERLHRDAPIY